MSDIIWQAGMTTCFGLRIGSSTRVLGSAGIRQANRIAIRLCDFHINSGLGCFRVPQRLSQQHSLIKSTSCTVSVTRYAGRSGPFPEPFIVMFSREQRHPAASLCRKFRNLGKCERRDLFDWPNSGRSCFALVVTHHRTVQRP